MRFCLKEKKSVCVCLCVRMNNLTPGCLPELSTIHMCVFRCYLLKEKQTFILVFAWSNSQLREYLLMSKYLYCRVSNSFMDSHFHGCTNRVKKQDINPPHIPNRQTKNMLEHLEYGTFKTALHQKKKNGLLFNYFKLIL